MSDPAPKRRKTSQEEHVQIATAHEGPDPDATLPTTPTRRRASYLSPTKASLARSHPGLLSRSPPRTLTESRGKLLRQELLAGRSREEDPDRSTTSKVVPRTVKTRQSRPDHDIDLSDSKSGFAIAIAQASVDAQSNPTSERNQSPVIGGSTTVRTPKPHGFLNTPRTRTGVSRDPQDFIKPALVKRPEATVRAQSRSQSDEPELPPTPVQLGLDLAPDRPRGLASSHSGGSRSGSGRHRRRVRSGMSAIRSSPLKPRDHAPAEPSTHISEKEVETAIETPASGTGETSEVERPESVYPLGLRREADGKQAELSELRIELSQLERDLARLDSLADDLEKDDAIVLDDASRKLLTQTDQDTNTRPCHPRAGLDAAENNLAYLTLFSPGNLQLSHTTIAKSSRRGQTVLQQLTLSAPAPWPSDVLQISFIVRVNAEEAQIESISQTRPGQFYRHDNLQLWIEQRLQNPLHRRDISSLVWGVGLYFEQCVKRARVFRQLCQKHRGNSTHTTWDSTNDKLAPQEAFTLAQYIDIDQIDLEDPSSTRPYDDQTDGSFPRRIVLVYEVSLTWTGDIVPGIEIYITGVSPQAQQSAKELFAKLVDAEGLASAFDSIWQLLKFGQNSDNDVKSRHDPQLQGGKRKLMAS